MSAAAMSGSETEEEIPTTKAALRNLSPVILEDVKERADLVEDLSQIGCVGLIERPWRFKDEAMV